MIALASVTGTVIMPPALRIARPSLPVWLAIRRRGGHFPPGFTGVRGIGLGRMVKHIVLFAALFPVAAAVRPLLAFAACSFGVVSSAVVVAIVHRLGVTMKKAFRCTSCRSSGASGRG
jgi:hypothetical protein